MGMTFENLTEEQLCDLMCGKPEEEEKCRYTERKVEDTSGARVEKHITVKALKRKHRSRARQ